MTLGTTPYYVKDYRSHAAPMAAIGISKGYEHRPTVKL